MFATVGNTENAPFVRYRISKKGPFFKLTEGVFSPYASGYGKQIPLPYKVKVFGNRWSRVYCVCYSNIGTCYIKSGGKRYIVELE